MSLARVVARDGETRSGLSRPGAQLPRRVPAKTDRTSSWQFGRLPGALRAPGSLSARGEPRVEVDRKSTRLNSSHLVISYAVFCLKKKKERGRLHNLAHAHVRLWPRCPALRPRVRR